MRHCLSVAPFALLIALAVHDVARADDPKPSISIKGRVFEISVSLDDKIKADKELAADCLTEGQRYADKNHQQTLKDIQGQKLAPDAYSFDRVYEVRSVVAGRYISILRNDYENAGGAHPNSYTDTILWDDQAKKRISIRPFFNETVDDGPTMKAMLEAVKAALKVEKKKRDIDADDDPVGYNGLKASLLGIGPVTLAPSTVAGKSSGLTFHYQPYAVGSYAEGEYVAFVPWEKLKPFLSAEGNAIFAGDRPKSDEDDQ